MRVTDTFLRGRTWLLPRHERQALQHAARTAVAAIASVLTARLFGLPESYWAAVTTLIVMQSEWGAALTVSLRRFAGTALGAVLGALMASYFGPNVLAFGVGIFLLGVLGSLLGRAHQRLPDYLERTAYRYGSITLAIVMLVLRHDSAWVVALHRFIEVSIGIGVGLVVTLLWPERQEQTMAQSAPAER